MESSRLTKEEKELEATQKLMEHIYAMMNASYVMGMHFILPASEEKGGNQDLLFTLNQIERSEQQ